MEIVLCASLILVSIVSVSCQLPEHFFDEKAQNNDELFQIVNRKSLVLRLPYNNLLKFMSYKDVSILHFRIPYDTRNALFTFKAVEEPKSTYQRKCNLQNVTLHLKASSLPVISPENISFPKHFLTSNQRFQVYTLNFESNDQRQYISVQGPLVGNWFAVAFLNWTHPDDHPIQPQGLIASCETILIAELSVTRFYPIVINTGQIHNGNLTNKSVKLDNSNQQTKYSHDTQFISQYKMIYKFFVPRDIGVVSARLTINNLGKDCSKVGLHVEANALPSTLKHNRNYIQSFFMNTNTENETNIEINVQPDVWHYMLLTFHTEPEEKPFWINKSVEYNIQYSIQIDFQEQINMFDFDLNIFSRKLTYQNILDDENRKNSSLNNNTRCPVLFREMFFFPLLRQTYRDFFTFDFDLFPDTNGTIPATLNLTDGVPIGFAFELEEIFDIGGTLTFSISMKHETKALKEFKPDERIKSIDVGSNLNNDNEIQQKFIIVCLHLAEPGVPTWPDKCRFGKKLLAAHIIINNTDFSSSIGLIHVPFPESGQWYITMTMYCYGGRPTNETILDSVKEFVKQHANILSNMQAPCDCFERFKNCVNNPDCLDAMNQTDTLKVKECMLDINCTPSYLKMMYLFEMRYKSVTEERFDRCNTSIEFSMSSSSCIEGQCGHYGHCTHYMSGGFVFSTCVCERGYQGWDCNDNSQAPRSITLLQALLFLTLSNLLLIPSIIIAGRRKYVTEAFIYFFVMFFSIFYHACDSGEDQYSFCLVKIGVLQYCDFYCSLLAIWVTLVAMANIPQQLVSLLHMIGAVLLAFGTELNKQSILLFLTPALTGITLISVSWGFRSYKAKNCYPEHRYCCVYIPIGAVLVMVGLICFAFLETKSNYHIVHSVWHMVMALSIICLLPCQKSFSKAG